MSFSTCPSSLRLVYCYIANIGEVRMAWSKDQQREYMKEYRKTHARNKAKEALRARELRLERRGEDFAPRGPYRKLNIDWSDPEARKTYHREMMRKHRGQESYRQRNKAWMREYNSRPEVRAARRAQLKAQAEAEGRQFRPWGRTDEEKIEDLRTRFNDPTLTPHRQSLARQAIRIKLANGYKRGLCQLRHRGQCMGRVEAHHWKGYQPQFWTNVLWLCKEHHEQAEGKDVSDPLPYEPDPSFEPSINSVWARYVSPEVKRCARCGEPKKVTEFHRAKNTTDRLTARCRKCGTAATMDSRAKHK